MKFTLIPVALLAAFAAGAAAQDSASASSSVASSTAASSSSSAASSTMTSAASSSSGSSGGGSNLCTVLGGDPRNPEHGCPYSSTTTPAYNLSSLISYFIGGYTRGPEAKSPDEVASEMAGSVIKYYPTLTVSKSVLASEFASAISATINAIADGKLQKSDLAPAGRNVPDHLLQYGVAVAAVVAAGAFAL